MRRHNIQGSGDENESDLKNYAVLGVQFTEKVKVIFLAVFREKEY